MYELGEAKARFFFLFTTYKQSTHKWTLSGQFLKALESEMQDYWKAASKEVVLLLAHLHLTVWQKRMIILIRRQDPDVVGFLNRRLEELVSSCEGLAML